MSFSLNSDPFGSIKASHNLDLVTQKSTGNLERVTLLTTKIQESLEFLPFSSCEKIQDNLQKAQENLNHPNPEEDRIRESSLQTIEKTQQFMNEHLQKRTGELQKFQMQAKTLLNSKSFDQDGVEAFLKQVIHVFHHNQRYSPQAFDSFKQEMNAVFDLWNKGLSQSPHLKSEMKDLQERIKKIKEFSIFLDHYNEKDPESEDVKEKMLEIQDFLTDGILKYRELSINPHKDIIQKGFISSMKLFISSISKVGVFSEAVQNFKAFNQEGEEDNFKGLFKEYLFEFLSAEDFNQLSSGIQDLDQERLEKAYIEKLNEGAPLVSLNMSLKDLSAPESITTLDLSDFDFSKKESSNFPHLTNLKVLDLSNSRNLSVEIFNTLPLSIEELYLPFDFDLSNVDFSRLIYLTKIVFTNEDSFDQDLVDTLPISLEKIIFPGSYEEYPVDLSRLTHLIEVDFSNLYNLFANEVNHLPPTIEILNLCECDGSEIDFERFTHLKDVYLEEVTGIESEQINSLPRNLEVFHLPFNSDVDEINFSKFPNLVEVNFTGTHGLSARIVHTLSARLKRIIFPRRFNVSEVDFGKFPELINADFKNVEGFTQAHFDDLSSTVEILAFPKGFDVAGLGFSRFSHLKSIDFSNVKNLTAEQVNALSDEIEDIIFPEGFDVSEVNFFKFPKLKLLNLEKTTGVSQVHINELSSRLEKLSFPDGFDVSGLDFSRFFHLKGAEFSNAVNLNQSQVNAFSDTVERITFPKDFDISSINFLKFNRLRFINKDITGMTKEAFKLLKPHTYMG